MKTSEQWKKQIERAALSGMGLRGHLQNLVGSIQAEALAEGERLGRIAGLREAAAICSRIGIGLSFGLACDARVALNDKANRLEKEQAKSISSDTPETKTKQER